MKNIKQIRDEFELITEAEQNEERKLIALIRSGLLDVSKLPILKRAMSKETKVLTPAERNALIELMNALMTQVLTNNAVYTKVRHNVMAEDVTSRAREVEIGKAPTSMATMPSILVLKRKAIRVYPGGQNVGLYYSQQLDKYVAVPFGGKDNNILSMNENVEQIDEISHQERMATFAKRTVATRESPTKKLQRKNLKKAAQTAVQTVANTARSEADPEKGIQKASRKASDMLDFANRYHSALKARGEKQTPTPIKRVKQKKASEKSSSTYNALNPRRSSVQPLAQNSTPAGSSYKSKKSSKKSTSSMTLTQRLRSKTVADLKRKKKAEADSEHEKVVANDKSMRGTGSVGGDILAHGTDSAASMIGHVIGKAVYRAKNPNPMSESQVDESLGSMATGLLNKVKSGVKNFAASQAAGGIGGSGGGKRAKEKKYVRNDHQSKLRIKTSGVQDDRDRRSSQQPLAAQSRTVQETTEVQLDGNTFLLNTGVANKVVAMYQTLNEDNRRKMVEKMSESEESLNKVITFAVRH